MQKFIPLALLLLYSCSESPAPPVPSTAGDFVDNNNGIGAAQVFGIDFSIGVTSSGASTDAAIHANFIEPEQSSAMKRFTLGDDITIQLESVNESEVRFTFNDQDFGLLNVGDKVVIDDERHVDFNGNHRSAITGE